MIIKERGARLVLGRLRISVLIMAVMLLTLMRLKLRLIDTSEDMLGRGTKARIFGMSVMVETSVGDHRVQSLYPIPDAISTALLSLLGREASVHTAGDWP